MCSLIGPHQPAVVLFDRGYLCLGNVDSALPIDAAGMKFYMDSLFDPTCVAVGVIINKLNLAPNRNVPHFISVLRKRRGLSTSKPYVSAMFFYPFSHWSRCFTDIHFVAFAWDLVNDAVLFWWFQGVFRSYRSEIKLSVVSDSKTVRMPCKNLWYTLYVGENGSRFRFLRGFFVGF